MSTKFFPHGQVRGEGEWRLQEERTRSGMHRRWRLWKEGSASLLLSTDEMEDLADLLDGMLAWVEDNPKTGVTG